jgi:hypothetical protein
MLMRLIESTCSMASNRLAMSDDKWFGIVNTPAEIKI